MRTKLIYLCLIVLLAFSANAESKNAKAQLSPSKLNKSQELNSSEKEAQRLNEVGLIQIKAKNFKSAEETFSKALSLDSRNLGVVFNLSSVYLVNKKEEKAIALLNKYIEMAPPDTGLNVRLGDAYFGTKNIQKATMAYEKAFKLEPAYPELANKLGTVYILVNNIPQAEKYLEIALSQNGKDLKVLTNLSGVYLANAKPDKAIVTAKKALQVKAGKELYVTLATAYEINKDYSNALISFQRAYDLGDQRDELKRKIEALKKVVT